MNTFWRDKFGLCTEIAIPVLTFIPAFCVVVLYVTLLFATAISLVLASVLTLPHKFLAWAYDRLVPSNF